MLISHQIDGVFFQDRQCILGTEVTIFDVLKDFDSFEKPTFFFMDMMDKILDKQRKHDPEIGHQRPKILLGLNPANQVGKEGEFLAYKKVVLFFEVGDEELDGIEIELLGGWIHAFCPRFQFRD